MSKEIRRERAIRRPLLTKDKGNAKLLKSHKLHGSQYRTAGLFLSPHKTSGRNVCAAASEQCIRLCLHSSGMGGIYESVPEARLGKTELLHEEPEVFHAKLEREITTHKRTSAKRDSVSAFRLDGTSDIGLAGDVCVRHPDAIFYDYTKIATRAMAFARGWLPKNYHLTFSRSEDNEAIALRILRAGGNVAVVVDRKVQVKFTRQVINGDLHDARFLDGRHKHGKVIVLVAKGKARGTGTDRGFVLNQAGWDRFLEKFKEQVKISKLKKAA